MSRCRIGISGWTYKPWRGTFYPNGLPQKKELHFASRHLNSIEINGSFYSLQRPSSFRLWHEQTPDGFVFSVKGSRFITHMKKLRDVETPLANFFAQGLLLLKEKLGPILWQFPPQFVFDEKKLAAFFKLLPRSTTDAAAMAKRHDARLKGRAYTVADAHRRLRYAIEIRHPSFNDAAFVRLLRKHRIALCVADTAGKWPQLEDLTSDFVYIRLHGAEELYVSGYDDPQLDCWGQRISIWKSGNQPADAKLADPASPPAARKSRDVYVYFDNDVKVRAPFDAMALSAKVLGHAAPRVRKPSEHVSEQARSHWPGG
jgi:uncharacterized protein YecE (DUF72 family)